MAQFPIYQLSKFQHAQLVDTTTPPASPVVVLESNRKDSYERRQQYDAQVREMDELTALGFFTNISSAFEREIKQTLATKDRSYRVYRPTEESIQMFQDSEEREVQ